MNWREFENKIRKLLALHGWDVTSEKILGHKKVDSYAEKTVVFGKRQRIAVEAKFYEQPLTKKEFLHIYTDYLPLIKSQKIDYLLLVTNNGVSASCITSIDELQDVVHITFEELSISLIDFSQYIQGIEQNYSRLDLDKIYIKQLASIEDLGSLFGVEEYVLNWVEDENNKDPLAILGSYGIGKSTLAARLAFTLAENAKNDSSKRIPILLNLSDLSQDQRLEGLLGFHFTSQSIAHNYNFPVFMSLNEMGRFVIILDGFDEMKKSLSFEVLKFNFEQLIQLMVPKSKVIILGRPSAFMNEDEFNEVIKGKKRINEQIIQSNDWPTFKQIELLAFDLDQISEFIINYAEFIKEKNPVNSEKLLSYANGLNQSESEVSFFDLIKRPVQLKMFVRILPHYAGDLDALTITILYSEFIDFVLSRESSKTARSKYSPKVRRQFSKNLAYWMWKNGKGYSERIDLIPDSIVRGFNIPFNHLNEAKRDLLIGSILEVNYPNGFFFPHKSFQEFLVAESIIDFLRANEYFPRDIREMEMEIIDFIIGGLGIKDLEVLRRQFQGSFSSITDWEMAVFVRTSEELNIPLPRKLKDYIRDNKLHKRSSLSTLLKGTQNWR